MEAEHLKTSEREVGLIETSARYRSPITFGSKTHSISYPLSVDDLPSRFHFATDDSGVAQYPIRYIDYLGYNWNEEDLSSSWRYLVSSKRAIRLHTRLENTA